MKRLQPVIWSKGTFLTPQHLQSQDRFLETVLQFKLESLSFRPWGFRDLQIQRDALADGTFRIATASGIFPDGLLFDIPHGDAAPAPRPLADAFAPDQNSIGVFLAIPAHRERGLNVSGVQSDADTRYRAETVLLRDENTGLAEKPVPLAHKNFRLLVEGEVREGVSALQVARVMKTAEGALHLDPTFVPPLLNYASSEMLLGIVRRLVEILAARSTELAGMRRQRNQSLADFTAADIARFWLLQTVNTHLPELNHFYESRQSHPERVFASLLELGGTLTTFSKDLHPRDLPLYDHENLSFCFSDLDEKIRLLLETVVPSNCVTLPLKQVQRAIYAAALDNDKYLRNTRLYLAVSAEMNQGDLIQKTPNLMKVCSASHIEHLIRQALPGAPLQYVESPPSAIPIKLSHKYFSISQGGVAWEAVTRARNLAVYVPGDFPNPQLELVILLPDAS